MMKKVKKGFLVYYVEGEYDSSQYISQNNIRYIKNRTYYEIEEIDIL